MSNPSEKSGNTVAIWQVQELTDGHNVAAKDIWKQLPGTDRPRLVVRQQKGIFLDCGMPAR